jgi:SAM-dependent methyltransferase
MDFPNSKRTHDKLYLNEDRRNEPKEYFKFIAENINLNLNHLKVIDICCATGDFLYYLNSLFPKATLYGADIDEELLLRAKNNVPEIKKCFQLDISEIENKIGKFDAIFMLGVHSIFDDLNWLDSIKKMLKDKDSRAYIFGIFNPDEIDVIIRGRKSNSNEHWETGWNVFSKASVGSFMERHDLKYRFIDFNLNIDIEKNINDPLRTWTLDTGLEKKIVINGLCLIHHFSLLEVSFLED